MQHHVEIALAPEQVLSYLSTPSRWQEWHPYPVAISAPSGSLPPGSRFDYTGGRAGKLDWEVVDASSRHWQTRARGRHGLEIGITYECIPTAGGTRVVRTLEYRFTSLFARMADRLVLRRRIERDSIALLSKLRTVSESVLAA
jgi:hypothetical protein